jgi:hypothetical protein
MEIHLKLFCFCFTFLSKIFKNEFLCKVDFTFANAFACMNTLLSGYHKATRRISLHNRPKEAQSLPRFIGEAKRSECFITQQSIWRLHHELHRQLNLVLLYFSKRMEYSSIRHDNFLPRKHCHLLVSLNWL